MAFLYFYLMAHDPSRVRTVAPLHVAYWHGLRLKEYRGGPFADRGGGLITFAAQEPDDAEAAVAGDPFMRDGLLARHWLREWLPTDAEADHRP